MCVCAGVQSRALNVCRIVITISYYALLLNTSNLHGDPYLNCFISALTEVPAYLIALLSLQYCSRHFCQASTLFVGGVMILCVHLIPIGNCGIRSKAYFKFLFSISVNIALECS